MPRVVTSEASPEPEPSAAPESPPARARGPKRPRFLETLPDDPTLRELGEAFEAGNYARVRAEAPKLAQSSEREDVRAAAADLARRIEPDPLVKYLFVLAGLLLLAVAAFAYGGHGHG
jgi:hypothetical protein